MPTARHGTIILADYDPAWPAAFDAERALLRDAIGEWAAEIEHVGSTAIPGIAAKPIIDIGVVLNDYEDAIRCITPLRELGYETLGEYGLPGRMYFRKLTDTPIPGQMHDNIGRTHQIHMYERGHSEHVQHILFRDYMRTHPEARAEYEQLKRRLASEHEDVNEYAMAKSDFVQGILKLAREEQR